MPKQLDHANLKVCLLTMEAESVAARAALAVFLDAVLPFLQQHDVSQEVIDAGAAFSTALSTFGRAAGAFCEEMSVLPRID